MIIWFLIDKFMYCINLFKIYFDEVNVVDYLIVSLFIVNYVMNLICCIDNVIIDLVIERS